MDELLELADVVGDSELEGVFVWLIRLIGVLAVLLGLGSWLLVDVGVVLPLALIVGGLVLIIAPWILLFVAELA
ncbi:hypothetical protein [Natrinema salaciae]|uniref:Uncharacterized protein n=1 Tax=Natrinema salaciae TaxID=1186196 RepID=A0A1H9EQR5_9EURY|nr:hypothetical protein [Natrinema salaciae]SEQ27937.1 hypothetical protein SAMN04489841_1356 [Natrinema salaciae]